MSNEINEIPTLDIDNINIGPYIRNTMMADKNFNYEMALVDIYRVMRPGEPPTLDAAINQCVHSVQCCLGPNLLLLLLA